MKPLGPHLLVMRIKIHTYVHIRVFHICIINIFYMRKDHIRSVFQVSPLDLAMDSLDNHPISHNDLPKQYGFN